MRNRIRLRSRPKIHERIISEDEIPYSIVQMAPSKEYEVWLHKDNNPYDRPERQSYHTGIITSKYGDLIIHVEGGRVHRLDGPAVERLALKHEAYFIQGIQFSEKEFWEYVKDTEYGDKVFARKFGLRENENK